MLPKVSKKEVKKKKEGKLEAKKVAEGKKKVKEGEKKNAEGDNQKVEEIQTEERGTTETAEAKNDSGNLLNT